MISVSVATKISHCRRFTGREQESIIPVLRTFAVLFQRFCQGGRSMPVYQPLRISRGAPRRDLTCGKIRDLRINRVLGAIRLIDRLKQRPLVQRRRNALDHRQVTVAISDQGLRLVDQLGAESRRPYHATLMNSLTSEIKSLGGEMSAVTRYEGFRQ